MAAFTRIQVNGTGFSGSPAIQFWDFASDDFTNMTTAEVDGALAAVRAFYDAIKANFTPAQGWLVLPSPKQYDPADGSLLGTNGSVIPALVSGTTATTIGPQQVAILVQKKTNGVLNNRLITGRSYLGPFQSSVTTQNQPQAATLNGINAALTTLLTAGGANWKPVVWSRPVDPSPSLPAGRAGTVTFVSSWTCSTVWGTQRRRNFV